MIILNSQYILDNVFTRKDFTINNNGKIINDFIYWVECRPTQTPIGIVGGGYLIIYPNGDQHHMYEHPDEVFRSSN